MLAVAGVSVRELTRVRGRLVEFADEMFESMARKDQRRWGECYLRGLMLDGKRKSIEPMAARLPDGDEQCLQQFVKPVAVGSGSGAPGVGAADEPRTVAA